jgi:hypothetical protein
VRTLTRFTAERSDFLSAFWGTKERDGKRRFRGVDPEVADVLRRYQALHSKWHQKTPEYRAQAAKRARTKGANKTQAAKAAKAAWKDSLAGKKWWADYRAKKAASK